MQEIAWNNYIGKSTASCIIKETCKVLWDVLQPIVLPSPTKEDLSRISNEFYKRWNIPNCVGALDGKHVVIQCPRYSGSVYFSYKKSFSIILMAVCDAYYRFTYVDIGAAGANHDAAVFRESGCGKALLTGKLNLPDPKPLPGTNVTLPHFLAADAAFPLHENIMRPYPGSYLQESQNLFNMRLSRARRCIENTFGILAQRWRRLRNPIIANVETCEYITQAVVVLHNFIQKSEEDIPVNERRYCPTGFVDWEDDNGHMHDGEWRQWSDKLRSVSRVGSNNASQKIQAQRNILAEYFLSPLGAIPNQIARLYVGSVPDTFTVNM